LFNSRKMSDRRKKDLEAKRKKLELLRQKQRERLANRAQKADGGGGSAPTRGLSPGVAGRRAGQALIDDALNFVAGLQKPSRLSPSLSPGAQDEKSSVPASPMSYGVASAALEYSGSLALHSVAPKIRAVYTKEVQCDAVSIGTGVGIIDQDSNAEFIQRVAAAFGSGKVKAWPPPNEEVISAEKPKPVEDKKVEEEPEYESEPEVEEDNKDKYPPIMERDVGTKEMRKEEFKRFFNRSSLLMERAVAQNEEQDIYVEYGQDNRQEVEEESAELIKFKKRFRHDESTLGRPVTSVAWSPLRKELFLASYAELKQTMEFFPDGTVHVWNTLIKDRPEFKFQCQSMVTVADFHPTNPWLVVGATVSGEVVVWDMRAKKRTPQTRTPFHTSHQRAVYAMSLIPTSQKAINIYSVCNEGKLMVWRDDILENPSTQYKLLPEGDLAQAREELLTTTFSCHARNQQSVVYGSSDGHIYKGDIFVMGSDKDANRVKAIRAHHGPITNVQYHPAPAQISITTRNILANTFLTSSFDWTVKLWDHKTEQSINTFTHMQDYVHDVRWSPVNPCVFACGDGLGNVNVFDLSKDWEVPVVEYEISKDYTTDKSTNTKNFAVCRLRWGVDGRSLLVGDSNGDIMLYEVSASLAESTDESVNKMQQDILRKTGQLS